VAIWHCPLKGRGSVYTTRVYGPCSRLLCPHYPIRSGELTTRGDGLWTRVVCVCVCVCVDLQQSMLLTRRCIVVNARRRRILMILLLLSVSVCMPVCRSVGRISVDKSLIQCVVSPTWCLFVVSCNKLLVERGVVVALLKFTSAAVRVRWIAQRRCQNQLDPFSLFGRTPTGDGGAILPARRYTCAVRYLFLDRSRPVNSSSRFAHYG